MTIRTAALADLPVLASHDRLISEKELGNLIHLGRMTVLDVDGQFAGWLRWNLFWDNTPFLNMLFLLEKNGLSASSPTFRCTLFGWSAARRRLFWRRFRGRFRGCFWRRGLSAAGRYSPDQALGPGAN